MARSTFTSDGAAPFVFDDNWDNFGNLRPQSRRLSATNADGVPGVPRLAIFNQYNGIGSRFHWWEPPGPSCSMRCRAAQVAVPARVRRSGQHGSGHAQPVRTGPGLRR